MKNICARLFLILASLLVATVALAGELTVSSPSNGDYLGKSNTLTFSATNVTQRLSVTVTITDPNNKVTKLQQYFTPSDSKISSGSMQLDFDESAVQGDYTIAVDAVEGGTITYPTTTISVKVDVVSPKFGELSPNSSSFVKGTVRIHATVIETNVDTWTVTVNSKTISNGSGASSPINVDWDTSGIQTDGDQTVTITLKDKAGNVTTKSLTLTVDRVKPKVTISYPTAGTKLFVKNLVPVYVDIQDASAKSVDKTGVDVIIRNATSNAFIARVSLLSFTANGTALRWAGRIPLSVVLPSQIKLVVDVTDRAGNVATTQSATYTVGK